METCNQLTIPAAAIFKDILSFFGTGIFPLACQQLQLPQCYHNLSQENNEIKAHVYIHLALARMYSAFETIQKFWRIWEGAEYKNISIMQTRISVKWCR